MAEQMADLHTVFLSSVLPEWFNNLESSADATNTTLRQVESSLFWAKWALVASVAVTVMMTGWQVWLAAQYEAANDKQQARSELLMTQQLSALQELTKQVAKQSQQTALPHVEGKPANAKSLGTTPLDVKKQTKLGSQKAE
jgi:hypothetical protein